MRDNILKILDCTLRDGAHINKGEFNTQSIISIIEGLDNANIDIIEVGFLKDGIYKSGNTFFNDIKDFYSTIGGLTIKSQVAFLLRAGTKNIEELSNSIHNEVIRVGFRQNEINEALRIIPLLKNKGYKVYANPIAVTTYTEEEILNLINELNQLRIEGVSIVDTYGSLTYHKFKKLYSVFNENLSEKFELGIHLHENKNLSSALIIYVLENLSSSRNIILDGSLLGMGRDPGNIPTELIISILEEFDIRKYKIDECLKLNFNIMAELKKNFGWGYNPYYFFSAFNNIDRTYGEFMLNNLNLNPFQINSLIIEKGIGQVFNEEKLTE